MKSVHLPIRRTRPSASRRQPLPPLLRAVIIDTCSKLFVLVLLAKGSFAAEMLEMDTRKKAIHPGVDYNYYYCFH